LFQSTPKEPNFNTNYLIMHVMQHDTIGPNAQEVEPQQLTNPITKP